MEPINRRALALVFLANGVSGFAQGVSLLAIPWHFARANRAADFNVYYATVTAFTLFWALYAGSIVDRFPRKNVFLGTNAIEGVVVLAAAFVGYAYPSQAAGDWAIVSAFFVTICGFQIYFPNLYAFAQEIVPPGELTKVTSMVEIIGQTTRIAAGVIGAALLDGFSAEFLGLALSIPQWSIWDVFVMDGATYLISCGLILTIRYKPINPRRVEKGSLSERLRSGFVYLRLHPRIAAFGLFSYGVFVAMLVQLHGVMPAYVASHLSGEGMALGASRFFMAVGSLGAGFFARRAFARLSKPVAVLLLTLAFASATALAAMSRSEAVFFLVAFLMGFSNSGVRIFRLSYLLERVPNEVVGRANSVFSLARIALQAAFIGLFAFSPFAEEVWMAYGVLAGFALFCALALFRLRTSEAEGG